ncbi:MAG: DUF177 domain-containing protein [Spirulinaceae cyanobacterium RM2_2_10]|nr:DUF177 domain-containing protein [Spirulinaceae cyanobacterium SM2_1_0]NJO21209.1 DUF177 domain-containing protein [Spirulinaceae cyanobacterium RM2_2_10]
MSKDAIYIPSLLQAVAKTETLAIASFIPGLESLTPARGELRVTHCTTYLEVAARAELIATLICHRCLTHYNQRLVVDTTELIWLDEGDLPLPLEAEVKTEDLAESLPARGYFQPFTWLYEQFCLLLPLQQICSDECQGVAAEAQQHEPPLDRRWAGLEVLRQQLE